MEAAWFAAGAFCALLLAALALAVAYRRAKSASRRGRPIEGYLDLIDDLSAEQRARVANIRADFLPRVEGIRAALRQRRAALAELLFSEPIDRQGLDEAMAGILAGQTELEREVIEHIIEERQLLTPAQRRQFYEIIVGQFSGGGLGVHDVRGGAQRIKRP